MSEKAVYFKNRFRNLKRQEWVPEHIRLERKPVKYNPGAAYSGDFADQSIRRKGRFSAKTVAKKQTEDDIPREEGTPTPHNIRGRQLIPVVGQVQEFFVDGDMPENQEFKYEEVPDPPQEDTRYSGTIHPGNATHREMYVVDDDDDMSEPMKFEDDIPVNEGEFCILVDGEIVFASEDINQINAAVSAMLSDGDMSLDNISVFRRCFLSYGPIIT